MITTLFAAALNLVRVRDAALEAQQVYHKIAAEAPNYHTHPLTDVGFVEPDEPVPDEPVTTIRPVSAEAPSPSTETRVARAPDAYDALIARFREHEPFPAQEIEH